MAITPYVLQHKAEEIDKKLNLIDENKNILSYPYTYPSDSHPEDYKLIDVEDGSFLTQANVVNGTSGTIFLNSCTLIPNKSHIISIRVTDILETPVLKSNFSLRIELSDKDSNTLSLSTIVSNIELDASGTTGVVSSFAKIAAQTDEAILKVYLVIPANFDAELLIKPQVEVAQETQTDPADWVPHMDKIGTYVDRRFNNTNKKFKNLANKVEALNGFTAEDVKKMRAFIACLDFELSNN